MFFSSVVISQCRITHAPFRLNIFLFHLFRRENHGKSFNYERLQFNSTGRWLGTTRFSDGRKTKGSSQCTSEFVQKLTFVWFVFSSIYLMNIFICRSTNSPKFAGRDASIRQAINSTAKPKPVYQIAWIDLLTHRCWLLIDLLNFCKNINNDYLFALWPAI